MRLVWKGRKKSIEEVPLRFICSPTSEKFLRNPYLPKEASKGLPAVKRPCCCFVNKIDEATCESLRHMKPESPLSS